MAEKYTDHSSFVTRHSSFYQWDELLCYDSTPGSQGLCPPGWHIPAGSEWITLFNFYGGNAFAGKPLQDENIVGFRAQTNGVFYLSDDWNFEGFATLFWSSSSLNTIQAVSHGMNTYDHSVSWYPASKANAFPARCLMD